MQRGLGHLTGQHKKSHNGYKPFPHTQKTKQNSQGRIPTTRWSIANHQLNQYLIFLCSMDMIKALTDLGDEWALIEATPLGKEMKKEFEAVLAPDCSTERLKAAKEKVTTSKKYTSDLAPGVQRFFLLKGCLIASTEASKPISCDTLTSAITPGKEKLPAVKPLEGEENCLDFHAEVVLTFVNCNPTPYTLARIGNYLFVDLKTMRPPTAARPPAHSTTSTHLKAGRTCSAWPSWS